MSESISTILHHQRASREIHQLEEFLIASQELDIREVRRATASTVTQTTVAAHKAALEQQRAEDEYNRDLRLRLRDNQIGSGMEHRP